jgi:predicted O-linked N-acetylglucosamine transferase (SPINDLY family)
MPDRRLMLKSLLRSFLGREPRADAGDIDTAVSHFHAGRLDEAADMAQRILDVIPEHAKAWNLLGGVAIARGNDGAALPCFEDAAALAPGDVGIVTNLAECRRRTGDLDGAEAQARAALQLDENYVPALHTLALTLTAQGRGEEAIMHCRHFLSLDPEFAQGREAYLFALQLTDMAGAAEIAAEHRRLARGFAVPEHWTSVRHANRPDPERRLRIGYVSADFWRHAASYFTEPLLAGHDRSTFEVFCYSGVQRPDEITERFRSLADAWRVVTGATDERVAEMVRDDGIDLLVDLSGHTKGNRLGTFARKPAPLQFTWFGYPGTTGLERIDYKITDAQCDPPGESESFYTEKLLRLPDIMYCYQPPRDMPEVSETPAERSGYVTFGAMTGAAKLTPRWVALWADLLGQVPGSRLILAAIPAGATRERLLETFARRGIDRGRITIQGRMPYLDFWALHRDIDLALDTYPCNGGTTTCETAWLGVPVVTYAGERYGGNRLGASMLSSMGLARLVAHTPEEYVAIARALAADVPQLAALRREMRGRMQSSALTDRPRFMRNLERSLREVWRIWCAGRAR